ncbi:MAG: erythromycin esterase family protein, partial [Saprospiraceae bacterium]|nr:erythromycin esterase family protein [Saprospiraceae bacterium]
GKPGSWEDILHDCQYQDILLITRNLRQNKEFKSRIPHRAIGVVYHPHREHYGNYVPSIIPERYDAFIHIDETSALHPFQLSAVQDKMPETYPFGL